MMSVQTWTFVNADISIFSETRFSQTDSNTIYEIELYNLFRNGWHF